MDKDTIKKKIVGGVAAASLTIGEAFGGDNGEKLKDLGDYVNIEQKIQVEKREEDLKIGSYEINTPKTQN